MNFIQSIASAGRDMVIDWPSRLAQSSMLTPLVNTLALPATLSERVCSYFAKQTVSLLSYSYYITPSFVEDYYNAHCQKRARTILTHIDPYLKAHPGLISLLLSTQAYQENPSGLRKVVIYARAMFSLITSVMAWFYNKLPTSDRALSDPLARNVISQLVSSSYKNSAKIITQYSLSYLYQTMMSEAAIKGLNQLSPAIYEHFTHADQAVCCLQWAFRAYVHVPFVYKLSQACYQGYKFYGQTTPQAIESIAQQLHIPNNLPGFVNRSLIQLHERLSKEIPFL